MAIQPYAKLRGRIVEKGFVHSEIAEQLGISKQAFHKKISGDVGFTQKDVIKLCEILDIDISDIGAYFYEQKVLLVNPEG